MNTHELDLASVRVRTEYDARAPGIEHCFVTVRCRCGAEFYVSGLLVSGATSRILSLLSKHLRRTQIATGRNLRRSRPAFDLTRLRSRACGQAVRGAKTGRALCFA